MTPIPLGLRVGVRFTLIGCLALMLVSGPTSSLADSRGYALREFNPNTTIPAEPIEPYGQDLTTRMRELLEGQANNAAAEVGFLLKEVQGDVLASWQEDFQTYPASSIKVLHHLHTLRTVENSGGTIDITTDTIPTCQSCPACGTCTACPAIPNPCMTGSNCSDDTNTSAMCSGNPPVNLPIQCVLQLMMIPSDNRATNAIQDYAGDGGVTSAEVGRAAITATGVAIGMTGTVVDNKLACGPNGGNIGNVPFSLATMEDLALLYEAVATGNDGLGMTTRNQFYANMLGGPNDSLATQIRNVIDQEAAALGMLGSDADVQDFKNNLNMAYKPGNISNSTASPSGANGPDWASIAGWVQFPDVQDADSCDAVSKEYVFGIFIQEANLASSNLRDEAAELLRDEIREAMQAILCARPPRVIAPTPFTVECNMNGGVSQGDPFIQAWLSSAVAIDACEELEPTNDAPAVFPAGCPSPETTIVTFSATDSCGSDSSVDSTVDVQDTTPPATLLPSDVVVECTGHDGAQVDLLAQAMDVCGDEFFTNSRTGASADASDTFPLGETVVAWDIFDECNNHSCGWTRVTVEDTSPPQVECNLATDELWPPNHDLVDVGLELVVEDACDPDPSIEIIVTSDEHPVTAPGTGGAHHCPDAIVCGGTVELRAERAGSRDGRVYNIQVEVTDTSGNVGMCQTSVSVPHDQSGDGAVDSGQNHDPAVCSVGGGNATQQVDDQQSSGDLAPRSIESRR